MKLPARFAKYELEKYLGGGMAEVYQARDTVLGRTVAVKLLSSQGAADEATRARFLLEARVSSGIAHENVITTYDYGEQDGVPYMVLEYLTGQTLKDLLHSAEPLPLRRRVSLALQLARALAHVHSLQLVHRDVKPDNIHIDPQGRLKLMDFGIVKTGEVNLTQAGYALGTPHYVAPELVLGQPVTPLADVYSFGVVFYELLAGRRAIQADTVEQIFYQILHADIDLAPLAAAAVPAPLQDLTAALTARQPAARLQSMAAAVDALEDWLAANPTQENRATTAIPSRRRVRLSNWWIASAAAASLCLAAALGSLFLHSNHAQARIEDSLGEMVLIPAGPFLFGAAQARIELPDFYIDVTEVTNEDYEQFCRKTGRPLPPGFQSGQPGYPVTNVTLADAQAYAQWAGRRLPSVEEWEKAAGVDGRLYPWGSDPAPNNANVADNPDDSWQHTVSVDAFRMGRSPFGVLQLIGNVRELTATRTAPSVAALRSAASLVDPPATAEEPWFTVKGGSFQNKLAESEVPLSDVVPARYRAADLGFRCAKDP